MKIFADVSSKQVLSATGNSPLIDTEEWLKINRTKRKKKKKPACDFQHFIEDKNRDDIL
jgi:hypothetical protein